MAEIIFDRTCNYWIDAGIVGLYDTLNKPVPSTESIGGWAETIKNRSGIAVTFKPHHLKIEGEENQIDIALSYALERIRTTLYDVSTEKQINNMEGVCFNEKEGIVHFPMVKPPPTAELVLESPRYTDKGDGNNLPKDIFEKLKKLKGGIRGKKGRYQRRINSCLPFFLFNQETTYFNDGDEELTGKYCISCGGVLKIYTNNKAKKWFSGESKNFMPFVEGHEANRAFHSYHQDSYKCWKCGLAALYSPLLLFFRSLGKDTYYALPHIPGNLEATHKLYRSLSGKRGLARVLGADHTANNYESSFKVIPKGIPTFTLAFYYDLWDRLLPKKTVNLQKVSNAVGLIDDRGTIFQTALFIKRDSGQQKSFILRETTIDRSAYFIKLFTYLKKHLNDESNGKLSDALQSLIKRISGNEGHLQRLSVIRASQALTEGRHVYKFLLPILSSDLKKELAHYSGDGVFQITSLFQKYDQWLFRKEDKQMANIVKKASDSGWHLSNDFWKISGGDEEEKKHLIKRYYYSIERSPSPVKFLEQVRHAYKKVEKEIPKDMIFHKEDGTEDIKRFEVYRVYFLAGMLNGLINKGNSFQSATSDNNNEEVLNNE